MPAIYDDPGLNYDDPSFTYDGAHIGFGDISLSIGAGRIGSLPIAGILTRIVPTPADTIAYDVQTNDRYQVVLTLTNPLNVAGLPQFLYWNAAPPAWAEALAAPQPDDLPNFYATDERGVYVPGALELHAIELKAEEIEADQLVIEFVARPAAVAGLDGGIAPNALVGFSGYVQGWGLPDFVRDAAGLTSGVAVSEQTFSASLPAASVASDLWPNVLTVRFPMRFNQGTRVVRAGIYDIRHCEIRRVYIVGKPKIMRET